MDQIEFSKKDPSNEQSNFMGLSLFHMTYRGHKHEKIQQKRRTEEKDVSFIKGSFNLARGWFWDVLFFDGAVDFGTSMYVRGEQEEIRLKPPTERNKKERNLITLTIPLRRHKKIYQAPATAITPWCTTKWFKFLTLAQYNYRNIWGLYKHMDVSKNKGKWMVYFMENPMNKWMIWGVFPLFLVQHPYQHLAPWPRGPASGLEPLPTIKCQVYWATMAIPVECRSRKRPHGLGTDGKMKKSPRNSPWKIHGF